jgi:hypothetical protein
VFLLDTEWLGGDAMIVGETVRVQARDDDDDVYELSRLARGMRGQALRLQQDLGAETGVRFVQPVVVFWNRFESPAIGAGNVVFVHGTDLRGWLTAQPHALSPANVEWIAKAVIEERVASRRRLRVRLFNGLTSPSGAGRHR